MSEEHRVSRRAGLKSLGVMGAAVALGGVAAAQSPAEPKGKGDSGKQAAGSPIDLAADRFAKGHS